MSSRVSGHLEKAEEEEEEDEEGSVNPTEVKMSQIVMPCHSNHQQELSVGQLLKWIDSSACLSGKLSGMLGVPASLPPWMTSTLNIPSAWARW